MNNKFLTGEKTYFCLICAKDSRIVMYDRHGYLCHLYSEEFDTCVLHITMRNFLKDAYNITKKSSLLHKILVPDLSKAIQTSTEEKADKKLASSTSATSTNIIVKASTSGWDMPTSSFANSDWEIAKSSSANRWTRPNKNVSSWG